VVVLFWGVVYRGVENIPPEYYLKFEGKPPFYIHIPEEIYFFGWRVIQYLRL
jgi:hypothetical protein